MTYNSNYLENTWNSNYFLFIKQHLDKFDLTTISTNPNITWINVYYTYDSRWDWNYIEYKRFSCFISVLNNIY